jgi:hypothetical protein
MNTYNIANPPDANASVTTRLAPRKCPHQRRINTCKECGGASFCIHQRQRSTCKECGGSSFCEHQRRKNQCKECGGSSICEHQRIRSRCKECHNLNEDGIDMLLKAASQI